MIIIWEKIDLDRKILKTKISPYLICIAGICSSIISCG